VDHSLQITFLMPTDVRLMTVLSQESLPFEGCTRTGGSVGPDGPRRTGPQPLNPWGLWAILKLGDLQATSVPSTAISRADRHPEEEQMDRIEELMEGHRDAITVKRVFGEPFQKNGTTVIPAAKILGGTGGGSGESPDGKGQGSGSGFGLAGKPAGAYVISGDSVRWQPAIDADRLIAGVLILIGLTITLKMRRPR
jgi:uncharacterized spore protein YtfJ